LRPLSSPAEKFLIAGGGLAGLAAGIELRRRGHEVEVHERGHYPLKKVCGEFLSPAGWRHGQELGVEKFLAVPPVSIPEVRFYFNHSRFFEFRLDPPALGLRREYLDTALAEAFREAGGVLKEGVSADFYIEGRWVDATGRGSGAGKEWLGWKAYVQKADLPGDWHGKLVMLPIQGGYCGISPVEDGRYVAALIAKAPVRMEVLLSSHPRLKDLQPHLVHFASIAGFSIRLQPAGPYPCLGDRWATWPPVVGDGMSAALAMGREWAQVFALAGSGTWERHCRKRFGGRYRLSSWLHRTALSPSLAPLTGSVLRIFPGWASRLYAWTRTSPD
jgi:flavin-dependent dehydrogenase